MENIAKQTLKYFWRKTLDYKISFSFLILTIILGTITTLIPPYLYKIIFDLLTQDIPRTEIFNQSIILLMFILLNGFISTIMWRCAEFFNNYFQPSVMRDIENDCFQKLEKHSYGFFANSFSGALVTQINRITRAFETIMDKFYWDILPLFLRIIIPAIILWQFSKIIVLTLILWTIIYVLITIFLYRKKYVYDLISAQNDSKVTAHLADSITNILNIKLFAKKEYEADNFYRTSQNRYLARKKSWTIGTYINIPQTILMLIIEIVLMYYALTLWNKNIITIGTVILIQSYIAILLTHLWNLGRVTREIYEAMANAEDMTIVLNKEEEIKDIENPEICKIKNGLIEIKNINFKYNENRNIFKNFSLTIKPKESIGLVGESGSGKSTLTKLMLRFADVNSGEILIDGQNITNLTQEDLREKITYVPQEPILFHRTLAENISYSKPNATMNEVIAVAKKANIHDFINSLPDKYDTLVGERGIKLSGGERQRVVIARAMLKDAPVIILDEATSSLDSHSEKLIQKAMMKLIKNKTTIIIAHRLSTIQQMDKIVVLHKGKIKEIDSHNKLIRKKGKYSQLWKHQAGGFLQ